MSTPKKARRGRPQSQRTPRTSKVIEYLRRSRNDLKRQLEQTRKKLAQASRSISREQIIDFAAKYLNKEALDIFKVQLRLQPLSRYGRRWPARFRGFALKLHSLGPSAYRYLSASLALPTERTLQLWLQDIAIQPGVMPAVLDALHARLKDLPQRTESAR